MHFCTKRSFSFLHVAIVVLCRLWNLELGESPCASLLRADSERTQWEFVGACRQERQDKWKGERGAHQATSQATVQWCPGGEQPDTYTNSEKLVNVNQLHAQIAAVSKALAELELFGDKELMQPLESRLAELKARLHGARPIGQQVDGLRGVKWKPKPRSSKRQSTSRVTRLNLRNSSHSLLHLRGFARQMDRTAGCQSGCNIDRDAVAQSLLGLLVPAPPPIPPDALRNGTLDNTTDMCDVSNRGSKHEGSADWPQNTNKVRLTTKTICEEGCCA